MNYQRNGKDGALDEILRRGYATASTDTGHRSGDQWWALGHPEKAADYLYRAKHVTTVAAKAIVGAYYGQPVLHSYFSSCSNGGRQGLIEAQRYPDDSTGWLENWVERGVPPAQFIGTKLTDNEPATRTVKFTRPVCLYPAVPRYKGTGDPNDSANFACQR